MNAGDGAQYLPGGEVERVTTYQMQELFRNSEPLNSELRNNSCVCYVVISTDKNVIDWPPKNM